MMHPDDRPDGSSNRPRPADGGPDDPTGLTPAEQFRPIGTAVSDAVATYGCLVVILLLALITYAGMTRPANPGMEPAYVHPPAPPGRPHPVTRDWDPRAHTRYIPPPTPPVVPDPTPDPAVTLPDRSVWRGSVWAGGRYREARLELVRTEDGALTGSLGWDRVDPSDGRTFGVSGSVSGNELWLRPAAGGDVNWSHARLASFDGSRSLAGRCWGSRESGRVSFVRVE